MTQEQKKLLSVMQEVYQAAHEQDSKVEHVMLFLQEKMKELYKEKVNR